MTNKTIYVQPGGGFDRVTLGTCDPSPPKAGRDHGPNPGEFA